MKKEIKSFEDLRKELNMLYGYILNSNTHRCEKHNNILKNIVGKDFHIEYNYPIVPHKKEKWNDYLYTLKISTGKIRDEYQITFDKQTKNPQKIYNVIKAIKELEN